MPIITGLASNSGVNGSIYYSWYNSNPGPGGPNPLYWNQSGGVIWNYNLTRADPSYGYQVDTHVPLRNDGLIEIEGGTVQAGTYGVRSFDTSFFTLANGGVIHVTGAYAYGVDIVNGGAINNNGYIGAAGDLSAVGVILERNTYAGDFINTGVIIGQTPASSPYAGIGVYVLNPSNQISTYDNSGLIVGDYAFRSAEQQEGLFSTHAQSPEVLNNSGQMIGVVSLAYGDDTVNNSGLIAGLVDLGPGADLYSGADSPYDAQVSGGAGDDWLFGGAGDDVLMGDDGADTIRGGVGDDYVEGGRGPDSLQGGSGFDTLSYLNSTMGIVADLTAGTVDADARDLVSGFEDVIGSRFGDQITGSTAGEVLEGLAGDDVLSGGGGADILYGDTGSDRLTGGAGDDLFVFNAGDGHDVITDFNLFGHDRLEFHGFLAAQSIAQQGSDTLITLTSTDSVLLLGTQASAVAADLRYISQVVPAPVALSLQTILVHDSYAIGNGEVLAFTDPYVNISLNQVSYGAALLLNSLVASPVLDNGGTVTIQAAPGTGRVAGVDILVGDSGGEFQVLNRPSGVIEAHALDGVQAIGIRAGGAIDNAGLVRAISDHGDALGMSTEQYRGLVANSGRVEVQAEDAATGVSLRNISSFTNSGLITVTGHDGVGLRVETAGSAVTNSGEIRVSDSTSTLDSIGVYFSYSTGLGAWTFTNTGLIAADYALHQIDGSTSFPPNAVPVATFNNSGELRGLVNLGAGVGVLNNTGLITGHVDLGADNDVYDGRGGTEQGGVSGGKGADILLGGAGADALDGGPGADLIAGGAGSDLLSGGRGDDSFWFATGDGADTITDFTAGGAEDSLYIVGYAVAQSIQQVGSDTLVTFSASDSLLLKNVQASALTAADFHYSAAPLTTLPTLPVAPDGPDIEGTAGDDILVGDATDQMIAGLGGADRLDGGAGDDVLYGGPGDDLLIVGPGRDIYSGDEGVDTLSFVNAPQGVTMVVDTYSAGSWTGRFQGVEAIVGSAFADHLQALPGADYNLVDGGGGDDVITGRLFGFDHLFGGDGNDTLYGGGWVDVVYGGAGDDIIDAWGELSGGAGADRFILRSGQATTITDFDPAIDRLVMTEWTQPGPIEASGSDTIIRFPALTLTLRGVTPGQLSNADFVLPSALASSSSRAPSLAAAEMAGDSTLQLGGAGDDVLSVASNATTTAGLDGSDRITGDARNNVLAGGEGPDVLTGAGGDDILVGGGGIDTAVFAGPQASYSITHQGGVTIIDGPDGWDVLTTVEYARFDDATIHLHPGAATTIDFNANPSTYAGALRDFDGNDLGGAGSWVLAGHVDIQGDGDQEYILFNSQIGRWATIGPAEDGKVYFDDHGWAGDTRVVGIYIDPEVVADPSKAGGPFDSQRRFQNDLNIGNLKGILGAGDYNHDGLQEVYFSLTDGTAYLHAYMHADGNIQYANYQSQQQVIDYLTANGFNHTTWDGWF